MWNLGGLLFQSYIGKSSTVSGRGFSLRLWFLFKWLANEDLVCWIRNSDLVQVIHFDERYKVPQPTFMSTKTAHGYPGSRVSLKFE